MKSLDDDFFGIAMSLLIFFCVIIFLGFTYSVESTLKSRVAEPPKFAVHAKEGRAR